VVFASIGFLFHQIDSGLEDSFKAFLEMAYKYTPKEINELAYYPAFAAIHLGGMKDDKLNNEIANSASGT
jgi:hypothetical protein